MYILIHTYFGIIFEHCLEYLPDEYNIHPQSTRNIDLNIPVNITYTR